MNYVEALDLISQHDTLLQSHIKQSTVFRSTSTAIQYDLIIAVSSVVMVRIKAERAGFVAIVSYLSSVIRILMLIVLFNRFH